MLTSSYPCENCEERHAGCWACCRKYAEARDRASALRAQHNEERRRKAATDVLQDGIKRTVRRYGRK